MGKQIFTNWEKWENRNVIKNIELPGVYCIAISKLDISGKRFNWIDDIKYVGATISKAGLKGRLYQFNNGINGKPGHGGAERFRYKHPNYNDLVKELFISVSSFPCDVTAKASPKDIRITGEVLKFEKYCIAKYAEEYEELPEFNDQEKSPKQKHKKSQKQL